jgi:quercetin dioxygenase-like cupin family protein
MTAHPIGGFHSVPNRPGMRTRRLAATEHGITSFFVDEFVMAEGASVPLHTHPIEEAVIVADGALTIQIGDETVVAEAESVVRIPPGVPHAFRNRATAAARILAAAAWDRSTFFQAATTYLDGEPRRD